MSVIQEALRRKMAEQAEQGVQTPAAPQSSATNYQLANPATQQAPAQPAPVQPQPSTSPPQPVYTHPPVAQAAPAERSTSWFILLFLFLLAGGAAVMFFVQSRQMGVAVTTVAPASTGGQEAASPVAEEMAVEEDIIAVKDPEPRPAAAETVADVEPAKPVAAPEPEPGRAIAARQATVTRDDWPKIELMGILAGSEDERSTAILNGALIMLNAEIDGVTLASVGEDGVYLEFKGDRQYIRIGEYTR